MQPEVERATDSDGEISTRTAESERLQTTPPEGESYRQSKMRRRSTKPLRLRSCSLSGRQAMFCRLYALGRSATEAYAEAYRCQDRSTARSAGSRLLTNVDVQKQLTALRTAEDNSAILALQQKRAFLRLVVLTPIADVDQHSNLCQSWTRKVRGEEGKSLPLREGRHDTGSVITVTMPDKLKALELDARLAGELNGAEVKLEASDGLTELLRLIRAGK